MGYKDFPLPAGQKSPPPKGWQELAGNIEIPSGCNVGRSTCNFVVVDIDDADLIGRFESKFKERITTVVSTPSGGTHYYFSGKLRNQQNDGWDVRGEGGYVVVPPSTIGKVPYLYETPLVPIESLRPFPPEIVKPVEKIGRIPELENFRRINRAKAYASTVLCIKGQQAHNTLFRLVCFFRDIGLTPAEAYAVILDWNSKNCFHEDGTTPYPWSTREIEHKLGDAYAARHRTSV